MEKSDTRRQIVGVAQELIQAQGYQGFSFGDVADRVGIRTSSVHYHFPTKADLAVAVLEQCRENHRTALKELSDNTSSATEAIRQFAEWFKSLATGGNKMCLGGAFCTGIDLLPAEVVEHLKDFMADHERWLEKVIRLGQESGEFIEVKDVEQFAKTAFSTLEGALLTSLPHKDGSRVDTALELVLNTLRPH